MYLYINARFYIHIQDRLVGIEVTNSSGDRLRDCNKYIILAFKPFPNFL